MEVLGQPGDRLDLGVLQHVGGIDPPLETAIEAQGDHPPQPVAVTVEEAAPGIRVAGRGPGEQPVHLAGILGRYAGHEK